MQLYEGMIIVGLAMTSAASSVGVIALAYNKQNISRIIDWCGGGLLTGCCMIAFGLIIGPK